MSMQRKNCYFGTTTSTGTATASYVGGGGPTKRVPGLLSPNLAHNKYPRGTPPAVQPNYGMCGASSPYEDYRLNTPGSTDTTPIINGADDPPSEFSPPGTYSYGSPSYSNDLAPTTITANSTLSHNPRYYSRGSANNSATGGIYAPPPQPQPQPQPQLQPRSRPQPQPPSQPQPQVRTFVISPGAVRIRGGHNTFNSGGNGGSPEVQGTMGDFDQKQIQSHPGRELVPPSVYPPDQDSFNSEELVPQIDQPLSESGSGSDSDSDEPLEIYVNRNNRLESIGHISAHTLRQMTYKGTILKKAPHRSTTQVHHPTGNPPCMEQAGEVENAQPVNPQTAFPAESVTKNEAPYISTNTPVTTGDNTKESSEITNSDGPNQSRQQPTSPEDDNDDDFTRGSDDTSVSAKLQACKDFVSSIEEFVPRSMQPPHMQPHMQPEMETQHSSSLSPTVRRFSSMPVTRHQPTRISMPLIPHPNTPPCEPSGIQMPLLDPDTQPFTPSRPLQQPLFLEGNAQHQPYSSACQYPVMKTAIRNFPTAPPIHRAFTNDPAAQVVYPSFGFL
ncbi:hypothetical protein Pelo_11289 [Pelomyxa schiedti]|nr:hypothetical protein Pelo_11289 [Pelomyxa schiedti]